MLNSQPLLSQVDHLVYATRDLDKTVVELEELMGVRATPGGQHPGRGTRNALISLGPSAYLEIIGPDPAQEIPPVRRWFSIDQLREPRIVTWAAKTNDVGAAVARAAGGGVQLGPVLEGSRQRPDGVKLSWQYTNPDMIVADGIVPFLINWGASPHPASGWKGEVTLLELKAEHPNPEQVRSQLQALGLVMPVDQAPRPGLTAILQTPNGRLDLC
ncbi:MAG: VOC family protein [Armatimonadetes bacterium]|nr:VOC family protein [Armatimonadota bacterium]